MRGLRENVRGCGRILVLLSAACAVGIASDKAVAQPASYVQPIDWSKYAGMFGVRPDDTFGQSVVGMLQNEARYELDWVSEYTVRTNAPGYPGIPYYDAYTNYATYGYEGSVRPLAGVAFGTAVLLATGTYNESVTGVSASQTLYQTELAIRGVALAHRANKTSDPRFGGRGSSSSQWQAAHWAVHTMEAAWLIWDQLSPATRTAVANMAIYEANSTMGYTVPYWRNPSGGDLDVGDTKAEENAWNAELPAVAQAMMPNHPNVAAWRTKASELQVSSYSRQSDNTSQALVDGRPLADWLNGFNSFEDGVVINHRRVHPDYMVSAYLQTSAAIYESLAEQYVPQSTVFNIDNVYRALTELEFTPGPDTKYDTGRTIYSPGGTIYKRTPGGGYTAVIYYPEGNDWTYQVTDSYLNIDLVAEWLDWDAGKDFDAMGWAQARVDAMLVLQNRPGHDGNIYEEGDWVGGDRGVDEDIYRSNAGAWLQWWLMQNGQMSPLGDHWGALPPPVPGDTNGDQIVDEEDAAVLAEYWGDTGLVGGHRVGDFDDDGDVDAGDAAILAANWGSHIEGGAQVPEPGVVATMVGLVFVVMGRRRRRGMGDRGRGTR